MGAMEPFATGGVVRSGAYSPMGGGSGLVGETVSAESVPLPRAADGRMGLRTQGGGSPVNVTVNVTAPDVQGFGKSQIAAELGRALSHGRRNG